MAGSRSDAVWSRTWPVLLLATAAFAVYWRVLGHDFIFNWDDNLYVTENPAVQGFSWEHVRTVFGRYYGGNYAPVQMLSYMLDYSLWGLRAGGFLLTNVLIHSLNGILFYRLLLRWHGERLLALAGAAFFLLHPVQVESVAWVSQRKNLLAMCFFLLAWGWYRRYREAGPGRGRGAYLASLGCFVLSLLSKSVAVIFPVTIIAYDHCFPVPGRRERFSDKVPFILAAGGIAALTLVSQRPEFQGGRTGYYGGSPLATFFTMLPVFCRYLGMVVWPAGLSADYNPAIHRAIDPVVATSALLLAGVAVSAFVLYRRDRRLGFWAFFFFLGLVPVSQIVPIVTLMNDRYLYFPLLGGAALFGAGAVRLRDALGESRTRLLWPLIALPLVLLAVTSFRREAVWQNALTLWSDTVARHPDNSASWEKLGHTYRFLVPSRPAESLAAYNRALELNPTCNDILFTTAQLYMELGDYGKARGRIRRLLDQAGYYVMGWAALGDIDRHFGNYSDAEKAYLRARALQPDALPVVKSLGSLALLRGKLGQARRYYGEAAARGNDPDAAFGLACVESRAGNREKALAWLAEALRSGYRDFYTINTDRDLAPIWDDPRFNYLVQQYAPSR